MGKLKDGDMVEVIRDDGSIKVGFVGEVVKYRGAESVGVRVITPIDFDDGHDCDGYCPTGKGRWMSENALKLLVVGKKAKKIKCSWVEGNLVSIHKVDEDWYYKGVVKEGRKGVVCRVIVDSSSAAVILDGDSFETLFRADELKLESKKLAPLYIMIDKRGNSIIQRSRNLEELKGKAIDRIKSGYHEIEILELVSVYNVSLDVKVKKNVR